MTDTVEPAGLRKGRLGLSIVVTAILGLVTGFAAAQAWPPFPGDTSAEAGWLPLRELEVYESSRWIGRYLCFNSFSASTLGCPPRSRGKAAPGVGQEPEPARPIASIRLTYSHLEAEYRRLPGPRPLRGGIPSGGRHHVPAQAPLVGAGLWPAPAPVRGICRARSPAR